VASISNNRTLRIQGGIDARANADLEHAIVGADLHPLNRLDASRVQRRPEKEIVGPRNVLVDPLNEIVFDDRDR
jgi:hypothetical protein